MREGAGLFVRIGAAVYTLWTSQGHYGVRAERKGGGGLC